MAFKAKIKGPDGRCCCGGGGLCVIFCSSRGGTARHLAFREFTSPSIPPKTYFKCAFSGTIHGDVYVSDPSCSNSPTGGFFDVDYSGSATISRLTGLLISSGVKTTSTSGGGGTSTAIDEPITILSDCFGTAVLTPTSATSTPTNACCPTDIDTTQKHSGALTEELSDEETDADAIARIPGIGTWGGYFSCGSGGLECCRTAWQQRGADEFVFEYVEARIRVIGSAFPPNASVTVKVDLLRRPYGAGVYVPYQTFQSNTTASPTGTIDVDLGVLSNDIGWETIATNCRSEITI